jgi:U6 snRNA-associated Sm-like protein LSm6
MENGASDAKDPSGFLSEILGAPVTVKLNSGIVYKGTSFAATHFLPPFLSCYLWAGWEKINVGNGANMLWRTGELQSVDGYMNIALEDTKEYVDGKLRRNYGDAFVRGNNGMSVSLFFSAPSLSTFCFMVFFYGFRLLALGCFFSAVLTDVGEL